MGKTVASAVVDPVVDRREGWTVVKGDPS